MEFEWGFGSNKIFCAVVLKVWSGDQSLLEMQISSPTQASNLRLGGRAQPSDVICPPGELFLEKALLKERGRGWGAARRSW